MCLKSVLNVVKSERANLRHQSSNFCSSPLASVEDKVFSSAHFGVKIYSVWTEMWCRGRSCPTEDSLQTCCPTRHLCHELTRFRATCIYFDPLTFCCCSFFGCLVMCLGGATPIFADLKDSRRLLMVLWKISCTSFSSWLTSKRVRLYLWRCCKPPECVSVGWRPQ